MSAFARVGVCRGARVWGNGVLGSSEWRGGTDCPIQGKNNFAVLAKDTEGVCSLYIVTWLALDLGIRRGVDSRLGGEARLERDAAHTEVFLGV